MIAETVINELNTLNLPQHMHIIYIYIYSFLTRNSSSAYFQEIDESNSSPSSSADGYVALFVRMLGLDQDPLDREQAVVALWKYSLGGKKSIDSIMQYHGCIYLTVNLLKSELSSTCEAAAGLLRSISAVNIYREKVADAGAIEEMSALLVRPSLPSEVYERYSFENFSLNIPPLCEYKIEDACQFIFHR